MKRSASLAALALLALPLAAAPSSCGEDAGAGSGGNGTTATGSGGDAGTSHTSGSTTTPTTSTGGTTGSGSGGATSTCSPEPLPPVVPPGWVEYTDWSCACRLYVPANVAALPKPLIWQTCPGPALGYDCRSLVMEGTGATYVTGSAPTLDTRANGSPILALSHIETTDPKLAQYTNVVAEVDGPVHSAIMNVYPKAETPECALYRGIASDGRHVIGINGDGTGGGWTTSTVKGVLGGSIDDLHPSVLARFDDDQTYQWTCNGSHVVSGTALAFRITAYPWSMTTGTLITSPSLDPDNLNPAELTLVGDAIFFVTNGGNLSGINVWTPESGAQPFIRWVGDPLHGTGSFGTDGKDMAWRYGEGRDPNGYYTSVTLMTAKYTTDPKAVVAKPLHSLNRRDAVGAETVVVGCGYAATFNPYHDHYWDLLVVRLSDGRNWTIPGSATIAHSRTVGITCKDLFALTVIDKNPTVARIALDSLGPGEPAP